MPQDRGLKALWPDPPDMSATLPPATSNDTLVSPEVSPSGEVAVRPYAPNANSVQVNGMDLVSDMRNPPALTKGKNGVCSITLKPPPGTRRYCSLVHHALFRSALRLRQGACEGSVGLDRVESFGKRQELGETDMSSSGGSD